MAGGARGEIASEISGDIAAGTTATSSQLMTAIKARLGEFAVTTDPAVEHNGHTCEPEGAAFMSAQ